MNNDEILKTRVRYLQSHTIDELYPEKTRKNEYAPFFRCNKELERWMFYSGYDDTAEQISDIIKMHLVFEKRLLRYKAASLIISYEYKNREYIIQTSTYEIHSKVLHFRDVAQYTINKKTNKVGNQVRGMYEYAILNNLDRFI